MAADRRAEVVLLTREECSFCEDAEKVLEHLAADYPLSVRTVAYDSVEGRCLALAGGLLFPPGILIDGRPFSYGRPSERKLRRELALLTAAAGAGG